MCSVHDIRWEIEHFGIPLVLGYSRNIERFLSFGYVDDLPHINGIEFETSWCEQVKACTNMIWHDNFTIQERGLFWMTSYCTASANQKFSST
mmetsp:Transcript_115058/g.171973  ORF Transcript_115058/g.171973 Transcript_115058/m.171973 type:complete len:92 (+) Transcript_115058:245-520(+)